jgi:hypothetical protein
MNMTIVRTVPAAMKNISPEETTMEKMIHAAATSRSRVICFTVLKLMDMESAG